VRFKVSLFYHKADNRPRTVERSWSNITRKVKRPLIRSGKDGPLFSPATFNPDHRLLKNVHEVSLLVLDYDHANFNDDLLPWRERCAFAAHTTFNHSETDHRFRVIIPLSVPIPPGEFPRLWKWATQISGGKIDAAASDASRMFYVPVRRSEHAAYLFEINEGDLLDWRKLDLPETVNDQQRTPRAVHVPLNLSDHELLEKAFASKTGSKIRSLYDGHLNGHDSQSEADLALCSQLGFWSGGDSSRLDRWFRSSRLYRQKWDQRHSGDGKTYGQMTIEKALASCSDYYSPSTHLTIQTHVAGAQPEKKKQEWELPAEFFEYDLPGFPVEVFPEWWNAFVKGLAHETQTPLDLASVQSLVVCSASVAGRVRIQGRAGWIEPLNIYGVSAMPPGERKSAVFAAASAPLEELEAELMENAREEIAKATSDRKVLEARLERLQKEAAKEDDSEVRSEKKEEAAIAAQELADFRVPMPPRLICADATPEALASLLADQGGRIAMLSPEGDLFDMLAGRYTNGAPNFDVILKGHSGDTLRVDRRTRSETVRHPALTIGLCVQPDVIRGLVEKPGFRGRGLIGRFLWSLPVSKLGRREIAAQPLADAVRKKYQKSVTALANFKPKHNDRGDPAPHMLYLTSEAGDLIRDFERQLEPRLSSEDGDLGFMTDWAGKLAGAVLRISGILSLTEQVENLSEFSDKVRPETMKQAIKIGEYFISHARAAYCEMGADPEIENAKRVLRWIEKHNKASFTKRDAHQGNKGRFKKVSDIEPALTILGEHSYIRAQVEQNSRGVGRPSSQVFDVNPYLLSARSKSSKSSKSDHRDNSEDSENFERKLKDVL
jgi:replicative DNA helicase